MNGERERELIRETLARGYIPVPQLLKDGSRWRFTPHHRLNLWLQVLLETDWTQGDGDVLGRLMINSTWPPDFPFARSMSGAKWKTALKYFEEQGLIRYTSQRGICHIEVLRLW